MAKNGGEGALERQRQVEDTVFDPTNCTISNKILDNESIAWNMDYTKFTGGGAWLTITCIKLKREEDEEEKDTPS
jgi:hypothetical protein